MVDLHADGLLPHGDGDLVQERQDQEADGPDADGDHGLGHRRPVELTCSAAVLRGCFFGSERILSSECPLLQGPGLRVKDLGFSQGRKE